MIKNKNDFIFASNNKLLLMHHLFYSYKNLVKNDLQYEKNVANINRTCWFCQCDCKEFVAICNDCKSKIKIKNDIYKNNN